MLRRHSVTNEEPSCCLWTKILVYISKVWRLLFCVRFFPRSWEKFTRSHKHKSIAQESCVRIRFRETFRPFETLTILKSSWPHFRNEVGRFLPTFTLILTANKNIYSYKSHWLWPVLNPCWIPTRRIFPVSSSPLLFSNVSSHSSHASSQAT